jgi:hypothetical protein
MRNTLLLTALLAALGCGAPSEADDDLTGEVEDVDAKADGVSAPVGTYRGTQEVTLLVLKTNKTYHLETRCPPNARCSKPVLEQDGTYKVTRTSSGTRYLVLAAAGTQSVVRYAYKFSQSSLSVRQAFTGTWSTLTPASPGWCGAPDDCKVQNLIVPRCIGEHTCQSNACGFRCGG